MRREAVPQHPGSGVAVLVADLDRVLEAVAGDEDHGGPQREVGGLGPGGGEEEGEGLVLGDVELVEVAAVLGLPGLATGSHHQPELEVARPVGEQGGRGEHLALGVSLGLDHHGLI